MVGLPDIAVKESRERIKSALRNCGFDFPTKQAVTVNLAPADIRKEGLDRREVVGDIKIGTEPHG